MFEWWPEKKSRGFSKTLFVPVLCVYFWWHTRGVTCLLDPLKIYYIRLRSYSLNFLSKFPLIVEISLVISNWTKNIPCSLEMINHIPLFPRNPREVLIFSSSGSLFHVRPTYPRDWVKARWSSRCLGLVNIQRSFDCPCNQQPRTNLALQSLLHRDDQGTDSQEGSTQPKQYHSRQRIHRTVAHCTARAVTDLLENNAV